ncbi:hypothetical protein [Kitasatospora sp. NPDC059327]|uniref:hypothetical protein n=1 Tax=Kitasatospora sp. NPDC059327 TaxID=3346803 RepID=UPI0036B9DAFB
MTETRIGDAHGPTHTGTGDQHFYYLLAGEDRLVRTGIDPLRVALEHRRWLSSRFVPPRGYGDAAERLEKPGTTVLLAGSPGSGRRTTAVVLLHRQGADADRFRDLSLADQRTEEPEPAEGDRILLDLSGASEQEFAGEQQWLSAYWDKVERSGARMAVVLPDGYDRLLRSDLRPLVVPIERPRGDRVLARHLARAGMDVPAAELRESALGELLERSAMRDVQRLAELMEQARSTGGDLALWARRAAQALRDRSREVADQVAGLAEGRQRALLLVAAMLNGAPADVVFHQAERLLAKLKHPPEDKPRLDRTDLTERLDDLRVAVDRDGRIQFDALAYDAAVRAHFWTYYPDLRPAFGQWVGETVRSGRLGPQDRRLLVARFAEQSLRVGRTRPLFELAEFWAAETRLLPEAIEVLACGLADERFGPAFRARVYDWATTARLDPNLVRVLARICLDVMAPTHPDQALVRLHHLARGAAEGGPPDAREALFVLVRRDRRLHAKLMARLWDAMETRRVDSADVGIFLGLMDPLSWAPDRSVVRGWRAVLAVAPSGRWEPVVGRWLSTALTAPAARGERLMRVLVEAAEDRADLLSRLYLVGYDWAATGGDSSQRPGRDDVARRFWQLIDRAQGIEPTDPPRARPSEERIA